MSLVAPFALDLSKERVLRANLPLPLDEPGTAWFLTAGRAQVFALDATEDAGAGRRYPLVIAQAGSLVLPPAVDSPLGLLLVGLDESTTAVPVPVSELERSAASDPAPIAALVEDWLDSLVAAVDEMQPDGAIAARPGERLELEAGAQIWPESGTVWVPGDGLAFGVSGRPIPAGVLLPVPPQLWLVALEPAAFVPVSGAEALRRPEAWAGVQVLVHGALTRMHAQLETEGEQVVERLEHRVRREGELLESAFTGLRNVLGRRNARQLEPADGDALLAALDAFADALGVERAAPPGAGEAVVDPVEPVARASGLRLRRVTLPERWWRQDLGPLLGSLAEDGRPVALLPTRRGGYRLVDPIAGSSDRVRGPLAARVAPAATMLYRPLPDGPLGLRDALRFLRAGARADLWRLLGLGLASGVLSLVVPLVTNTIFGDVVPNLRRGELWWLTVLVGSLAVAAFGLGITQQLVSLRLEGRAAGELQAAVWDRILDLPLTFFRRFSAGQLTVRANSVDRIHSLATSSVAAAALALPVGVFSMGVAFYLQPRLALFALVPIVVVCATIALLVRYQLARGREAPDTLFGIGLELVQAIGKLRVADAERRALVRWVHAFQEDKRAFYVGQQGFVLATSVTAAVPAVATLVVVAGAATLPRGSITPATFIAFNAALLQALAAFTGLTAVGAFLASSRLLYEDASDVLEEPRERAAVRSTSGELRGQLDVAHVTLRYAPDEPLVLDGVSFSVAPGEFVAIVGPSGAGKSSLLRVLLGFERLDLGTVRYDGHPLDSLDLASLRRQIGVVTQSARLMPGDVLTNILGARPLTVADAWEAARLAGIEDDIRALPLGMHTKVTDGASFSGGQRQGILIARAVAGRPRILLFDEATSALDNRTQAEIAAAVERMRATRVVIAHRLSTVRRADRILVLQGGRLVQEGPFDELIAADGPFRELAERQLA